MSDSEPSLPTLEVHRRVVRSPFGLHNVNENALTFALGYTFQQSLPFLRWFLTEIGVVGLQERMLRKATIHLQRRDTESDKGVTDIEVRLPGHFHVIVEAKIGVGLPSVEQCRRYIDRLTEGNEPIQKLVALVQTEADAYLTHQSDQLPVLAKRLVTFCWVRFIPECLKLLGRPSTDGRSRNWVREFYTFLDEDYRMKAFSTEVWILAASTREIGRSGVSHWDVHKRYRLWWDFRSHTVRPLYLAFRADGVVDALWKVVRIEHGIPISDRVPELRTNKVHPEYRTKLATIWHFDAPVSLPNPLRTGGGMYNRRVRCDFDLLLTCATVSEIEVEMARRRPERN